MKDDGCVHLHIQPNRRQPSPGHERKGVEGNFGGGDALITPREVKDVTVGMVR
jgi:hypothetical protein